MFLPWDWFGRSLLVSASWRYFQTVMKTLWLVERLIVQKYTSFGDKRESRLVLECGVKKYSCFATSNVESCVSCGEESKIVLDAWQLMEFSNFESNNVAPTSFGKNPCDIPTNFVCIQYIFYTNVILTLQMFLSFSYTVEKFSLSTPALPFYTHFLLHALCCCVFLFRPKK